MSAEATALPAPRTDTVAVAAAGATLVLWASAFVGIRAAGDDFSPGALALGRLTVAAIVLGLLVLARREPLPALRDVPLIALGGLLWLGAYSVLLNAAERRVDAGTAAMLVNVGPILIALLAGYLLGEGYPRTLFAGCAIAFAGVALIATATSGGASSGGLGVALCLLAALGYAGGVVAQKVVLRRVSGLQTVFLSCLIAAIGCSWAVPSLGRGIEDAPASSIAWVLYLGAFPTAIGFVTWTYALARTSAGRLAATTYLVPAISILLAWAFLGETPPALAFLGGAVCLVGVAVARRRPALSR
ncbi:MAG TPA: DMT family transporter [Gaiellaceae bacterium]|jgi:drug/metabolite transporter (DMT)-like permease